jgi:hypothetical protein
MRGVAIPCSAYQRSSVMYSLDAFDAIKELNVLVESGLKNVYLRLNHGKVKERRSESGVS